MGEPYEIIIGPLEVYLAPVGETFPDVDTAPGGNWVLFGTNGNKNYEESGVTLTHEETVIEKTPLGCTAPVKAARQNESHTVAFNLMDLTAEVYSKILNGNAITTVAAASGTPGYKEINMRRGFAIQEYAMLIRGTFSPYGDGMYCQWQIPRCYFSNSQSIVFKKDDAAMFQCMFKLLEDLNAATEEARHGKIVFQTAVALP